MIGKAGHQEPRLHPQEGSREVQMPMLSSLFPFCTGNWPREWCHPWVSLSISIKVIKIKSLRLVSQVILYIVVLTTEINHHNMQN